MKPYSYIPLPYHKAKVKKIEGWFSREKQKNG